MVKVIDKLLIIGQAPGKPKEGQGPCEAFCSASPSGKRIRAVLGDDHDYVNLLLYYPGRGDSNHPKGHHWPVAEARCQAELMLPTLQGRKVVFAGRNVADAFGINSPWLTWAWGLGFKMIVVPHPSGVNRWWNSPENLLKLREAMQNG